MQMELNILFAVIETPYVHMERRNVSKMVGKHFHSTQAYLVKIDKSMIKI